jgi:hypothetical protein
MHEIVSRKNAKQCGDKFYFTGKVCKEGHEARRYLSSSECETCKQLKNKSKEHLEASRKYRSANPDKCKEAIYSWRSRNPEADKAITKRFRDANKEVLNTATKQWREDNRDKVLEYGRIYRLENEDLCKKRSRDYKQANRGKVLAWNAKRRAAKLRRTPPWLTKTDELTISELYTHAKDLEATTGLKYHVDHIIPLQGTLVSGLHTPDNLQIILASENLSKSNSYAA